jgi:hypothetical protein
MHVVATYGQRRGGVLDPTIDERRHHKVLFVAARLERDHERRR